jgi:hypothetical protein
MVAVPSSQRHPARNKRRKKIPVLREATFKS